MVPVQHPNLQDTILQLQPTNVMSHLSFGFHQPFSHSQENQAGVY